MRSVRLALLGAFAFPAPLGSQRFAAEQAQALRAAGAEVELLAYAARGFALRGLDPRKPAADVALARTLAAAHRAHRFDAVLAHNAEAALVALALRARLRLPVLYVAHTLWAEELPTWLPAALAAPARRLGAALDAALARRADAVQVLSEAAEHALAPVARGPLALLPPGHAPEPAPEPAEVAAAAARHGLAPEGYALYAGNLDRYQEVALLDAAAARGPGLPLVVVTHAAPALRLSHLRVIEAATVQEVRALVQGAALTPLPRRSRGGFPMKLLDAMAAGRAIVARRGVAGALVHAESAWLLADDAGPDELAAAIRALAADAALRARLGAGASRVLAARHAWPPLAEATLAWVRAAIENAASR
jgi:glycosyltransferase involved in cell wall biosynthesis